MSSDSTRCGKESPHVEGVQRIHRPRQCVIDLATAVVIGAVTIGLVTAFTTNVVTPLVSRIRATPDSDYGFLRIPLGNDIAIDLNAVVSAAINFLIIAAVVYFIIVVPYKKLKELDTKVEEEETQLTLLTEIRDIMAENGRAPGKHGSAATLGADEARKSGMSMS